VIFPVALRVILAQEPVHPRLTLQLADVYLAIIVISLLILDNLLGGLGDPAITSRR